MALRKVGKSYQIDICINGARVRKTIRTDFTRAREYHDKLKAKLWDKEYLGKEEHTWDEAIEMWRNDKKGKKSIHKDETIISYFDSFFKGKNIVNCDIKIAMNRKTDVSQTTLNRYKSFIRSLFRQAKLVWGWNVKVPHFTYAKELHRERYLTQCEYERLLWGLPDNLRNIVTFALETGLRRSNILDIDRSCVDVESRTLRLPATCMKTGKPLSIPLSERALQALREEGFKFRFTDYDYIKFKNAAKKVGINDLRFHDLRHTFATWKAQEGVPLEVISKLLGHTNIKTTQRYSHLCIEDLRKYI